MKIIETIKHFIKPTHCRKHKTKLKVHGWHNEQYCEKCFDKTGHYTYL